MFGGSCVEQKPAGHTKMHRQRALIELHDDELAAPLNRLNGAIREAAGECLAIPRRHEARGKRCRHDAAATQTRRERADYGFDFGEFGHGGVTAVRRKSRPLPLSPGKSPAASSRPPASCRLCNRTPTHE